MGKRGRIMLVLVALLALAAGGSLSLFWDVETPLRLGRGRGDDDGRLRAAAHREAQLVLQHRWPDGTVGRIAREPVPPELEGLTAEDIAALHPSWRVESMDGGEVVVSLPCQRGEEGFLGVSGGRVAIYDGSPDGCSRLRELTGIPLRDLPSFQVTDLRRGIAFGDEDELRLILEGLRLP